jgi:hypothetical protein
MCLRQDVPIKRIYKNSREASGVGWKVFELLEGKLHSLCFEEKTVRPVGKWITAKENTGNKIIPEGKGFHIYLRFEDTGRASASMSTIRAGSGFVVTTKRKVRKVRFRHAHHRGLGDGGWNNEAQVVVADQIFIEKKS